MMLFFYKKRKQNKTKTKTWTLIIVSFIKSKAVWWGRRNKGNPKQTTKKKMKSGYRIPLEFDFFLRWVCFKGEGGRERERKVRIREQLRVVTFEPRFDQEVRFCERLSSYEMNFQEVIQTETFSRLLIQTRDWEGEREKKKKKGSHRQKWRKVLRCQYHVKLCHEIVRRAWWMKTGNWPDHDDDP